MDREGANGRRAWWRATIRDLVLLIAGAEFLYWLVRRADASEALLEHWPLVAAVAIPLCGLAWSIGRAYRVEPGRQTLTLVVMIVSLLGLLAAPLIYGMIGGLDR
jgi:hypothetical protein